MKRIIAAIAALTLAATGIGIGLAEGATTVAPTATVTLACSGVVPTESISGDTLTGKCPSAVTPPPTTTTTTTVKPPPTTTTTVPPTTTTTTAPSGTCPGGKTTGEDYSAGGTLGPFTDAGINNSNGYNTYVAADGFWANPSDANTICVTTASNWTDTVNFGVGNPPQVQGYPDTQQLYDTAPTTLTSTFNVTDPPDSAGTWEAAYDVWTNDYPNDVMIWEDTSTARAAGSFGGATVDNTNVTIDGVSYTLVHFGTASQPERMLIAHTNVTSGSVNITDVINWLIANKYLPAGDGVNQSDFGWEILQTAGSQTFGLNSYSLTSS